MQLDLTALEDQIQSGNYEEPAFRQWIREGLDYATELADEVSVGEVRDIDAARDYLGGSERAEFESFLRDWTKITDKRMKEEMATRFKEVFVTLEAYQFFREEEEVSNLASNILACHLLILQRFLERSKEGTRDLQNLIGLDLGTLTGAMIYCHVAIEVLKQVTAGSMEYFEFLRKPDRLFIATMKLIRVSAKESPVTWEKVRHCLP